MDNFDVIGYIQDRQSYMDWMRENEAHLDYLPEDWDDDDEIDWEDF